MLFQLIIHQFFAQYQNEMNSTKEKAEARRSLITLISNKFCRANKTTENIKQQQLSESDQTDQIKLEFVNLQSPIPKKSHKTQEEVNVN